MPKPERAKIDSTRHSFEDADESEDIGKKTKLGLIYTILSNGGQFIIQFVGSIILARILFPEDFGLMAIVSIVLQLAVRLTNFGFTMVLVQRKDLKREHIDTVFITNLCLMSLLTIGVFLSAPLIAEFFDNTHVEPILKIISFNFMFLSITSVPRAILGRKMMFKELEIANSLGKLIGVFFPVCFALVGLGVWSLVYGVLLESFILAVILIAYSRWWPKLQFDLWALKDVFSFGLWIYVAGYVNFGINKVDFFTVGKFLNVTQLGFYERAFNLMSLPRQKIAQRISTVMFSSYSRIQDNDAKILEFLKKMLLYISLVTYPLMVWMFFVAPSLIVTLFGDKWLPAIRPFQIMCLAGVLDTMSLVLDPTITARGYIGQRVRRDFVYLLVLCACILTGVQWGINGVAWGTTAASIFRLLLKLSLVIKTLPFSYSIFFNAQKSATIYSICLAAGLLGAQFLMMKYVNIHSFLMLACMSAAAMIVLTSAHLIIRFNDVDVVIDRLTVDLQTVKQKLFKKKRPIEN